MSMTISRPALHQARCVCSTCGSHTVALVGRMLVSGICSCCGGQDLERIGPLRDLADSSLRELCAAPLI